MLPDPPLSTFTEEILSTCPPNILWVPLLQPSQHNASFVLVIAEVDSVTKIPWKNWSIWVFFKGDTLLRIFRRWCFCFRSFLGDFGNFLGDLLFLKYPSNSNQWELHLWILKDHLALFSEALKLEWMWCLSQLAGDRRHCLTIPNNQLHVFA